MKFRPAQTSGFNSGADFREWVYIFTESSDLYEYAVYSIGYFDTDIVASELIFEHWVADIGMDAVYSGFCEVVNLGEFQNNITCGSVTKIIWDAAIEHFTEAEIAEIMKDIKKTLAPDGILSGYTIINTDKNKKLLEHHEREFTSKDDLRTFFTPYFKNVYILETNYQERSNLYFYASDAKVPFL